MNQTYLLEFDEFLIVDCEIAHIRVENQMDLELRLQAQLE